MATDTDAATSWHTVVPTALGELTLVRDADALLGLYFPNHWYRHDPVTYAPHRADEFDEAACLRDWYLSGQRREFDPALDPRGDTLQQRVGNLLRWAPHGETVTHGALSDRAGGDVAAQQVGAAVGRNPPSIVLSCHRVVGAAGKLTGYGGGPARKRHLLDLEQTGLPPLMLPEVGTGRAVATR